MAAGDQPIPDTISAGLSTWSNPLGAIQNITSGAAFTLLQTPGYQSFALGAILPGAALLILLIGIVASGTSGGGRRR